MALVLADRVKETTTTAGTGTVTLLGASAGFQSFAVIGNTNTTFYTIAGQSTSEWEVGIGTYTLSGTTLARTTVLSNSSGTQPSALSFSAGTKDVFVTYPSSKSVNLDASGNATALGTPAAFVGTNITGTASSLTAGNVTTNANLTGDVTSVGNATTLTNAPVIAKVLTGYVSGAGTVAATDSILQAIQKLNGNDATNANLTGMVTSVGNATTVVTNANLTGDVTSVGNATAIAAGVIVDADISASAGIVDTKLATISTAAKVSNSATTATSANTASAIVARDASGNFSAGTITASLTGNASGSAATFTSTSQNSQFNSIGVGTAGSATAGEIRATNNITAYYSDERLKTKIGDIEDPLSKVHAIKTMLYHANEIAVSLGYDASIVEVGVTAQSVQVVMPQVVVPAPIDDKYLTVRYEKLVPLLIEAIKALDLKVDKLAKEIK
jgi:hypothetical protein